MTDIHALISRLRRAPNMTLSHGTLLRLIADAADTLEQCLARPTDRRLKKAYSRNRLDALAEAMNPRAWKTWQGKFALPEDEVQA